MHVNELGEGNQKGHSSVQLSVQILPLIILEIWWHVGMLHWQTDSRTKSAPGKENSTSRVYFQPWPGDQPVFHHAVNSIRTGILTTCHLLKYCYCSHKWIVKLRWPHGSSREQQVKRDVWIRTGGRIRMPFVFSGVYITQTNWSLKSCLHAELWCLLSKKWFQPCSFFSAKPSKNQSSLSLHPVFSSVLGQRNTGLCWNKPFSPKQSLHLGLQHSN